MKRPQPEKAVIVTSHSDERIVFYASDEAMNKIEEFGSLAGFSGGEHILTVSRRYDFNEVLKYMKEL